jgi:hypothetical protein
LFGRGMETARDGWGVVFRAADTARSAAIAVVHLDVAEDAGRDRATRGPSVADFEAADRGPRASQRVARREDERAAQGSEHSIVAKRGRGIAEAFWPGDGP